VKNSNLPVTFIAEISANHLGSLSRAHELVDKAAAAGATAVKFQTYTADTMTLNLPNFSVGSDHELWGSRTLYSLYQEAMTPWEWHPDLFDHCREVGVIPFSSPFDLTAVKFLESINVPMYKISSLETSDLQLIKAVAETGKPVIVSTGATEWNELEDLVEVFRYSGNKDLTLLVCTSSYPAEPKDAHISRMETLKKAFQVKVGLSDHTLGLGVSVAAIALGATVIEKHLTLRRSDGGVDSAFSMEPEEFSLLVREGISAHSSVGNANWSIQDSEQESRKLRRSLYVTENVKPGDQVTRDNVRAIRPGGGCSPALLESLLGKSFIQAAEIGTPMWPSLLKHD
jgi:pseudaminic acid synthase